MRTLSRFALIGLIGGASAACSTDTMRFSDPFSNPFSSSAEPGATGSLPQGDEVAAPPIRSAPIQSRPLAAPAAPMSQPAAQTARLGPAAPVTSGHGGWSAQGGTTITVAQGDSLTQMSTRFGVPAAAILSANGLSNASQIAPGRQIVIPVYSASGSAPAMTTRVTPPAAAPRAQAAPEPRRVAEAPAAERPARVRPGQPAPKPVSPAAAERAAKLNTRAPEPAPVAKAEPKPEPKKVAEAKPEPKKPAEKVAAKTEAKAEPKKVAEAKPEPKKPAEAKKVAEVKPEPKKPAEKVAEVKPEPKKVPEPAKPAKVEAAKAEAKPVKVATAGDAPVPAPTPAISPAAPPPEPDSSFRWPARGRVISGYGSSGNEGINIAVPEGTPVKAAEEGTVAYAGSDVKGYGKLVLVRHTNGYVSAYAHNGEIDVRPGEKVKRGQVIAKSGASGNVTSPQLHFEIRKGATPVDPIPHLASN
ncbi:peptidoglycan DD-metalloendopeptidase family protein [uncultured Methylobacterium sp.]|uniref:peptidoglycan DD-metalloendopeptidase family protein n=1 Tax=uncultured Methylobacterium sp. TaxID=157278 RepID=UPI00261372B6|nr:peptidoglycan DD-metalloendopeptidase family protein [uncultured Methylobacterium sp.]